MAFLNRLLRRRVVGAHYFGAHDPLTFWECFDPATLPNELAALREMGFNTVFLLIPWHAFFPEAASDKLDPWYEQRLHYFLRAAEAQGLAVHGRLFYSYSTVNMREAVEHTRQYALLMRPEASVPILAAQAAALARSVGRFSAWEQAFVTWEDFWPLFEGPPHWSDENRQQLGKSTGFSDWLKAEGKTMQAEAYGLSRHDDGWVIPKHQERGMLLWMQFFDHLLRTRIMAPCRLAFPNLGLEIRVDAYPVSSTTGEGLEWHYFDAFKDCPGPRYLYWGPFYGMRNEGEMIDAATALQGLENLLKRFSVDGGSPLIVDQLNFTDETLKFASHNARIEAHEMEAFVVGCAPLLKRHTHGYAVWALRDYRENWLSNAGFQREQESWEGGQWESGQITLVAGERLSQVFVPELRAQAGPGAYTQFFCDVLIDEPAGLPMAEDGLQVQLDEWPSRFFKKQESGLLRACIPAEEVLWSGTRLRLSLPAGTTKGLNISAVYFYGFVQRLRVIDEDGHAANYNLGIRRLNRLL